MPVSGAGLVQIEGFMQHYVIGPADEPKWENRGHFFAAAAEAMRRILVERARHNGRLKRGGGRLRVELLDQAAAIPADADFILALEVI